MTRKRSPENCGCNCPGCRKPAGSGTHCLAKPCTRTRNRRNAALINAGQRYRSGRVIPADRLAAARRPAPKPKPEPKPEPERPARRRWFVFAGRNRKAVVLPAPRGRDEAVAMATSLQRYGWSVGVMELPKESQS